MDVVWYFLVQAMYDFWQNTHLTKMQNDNDEANRETKTRHHPNKIWVNQRLTKMTRTRYDLLFDKRRITRDAKIIRYLVTL